MENKYLKLRLKYLNDYDFINYLKSLKTKTIKSIYKDYLLEIERLEDIYLNKRENRSNDYKEYKEEKRFIVYFNSYLSMSNSTQTNTVKSVRKFSNIQR